VRKRSLALATWFALRGILLIVDGTENREVGDQLPMVMVMVMVVVVVVVEFPQGTR